MASRPGAQGRLRPEHRKRRGSSAFPARENRYWEQRNQYPYTRSAVGAGTLPRRHVYAAETPAYQALSADDLR